MAAEDSRVKVIVNTRNFGPTRSPYHGFLQRHRRGRHPDRRRPAGSPRADPAVPAEVGGGLQGRHRDQGRQRGGAAHVPRARLLLLADRELSSDVELVSNFTGFGLYDREVVEQFRETNEQYPYFRGLVCDFGYQRAEIEYVQPARKPGTPRTTSTRSTTRPCSASPTTPRCRCGSRRCPASRSRSWASLVALIYLVAKIVFWNNMQLGLAPLLIGIYFFGAVQLFFIGMLGEYIGSIHTQVHKRPSWSSGSGSTSVRRLRQPVSRSAPRVRPTPNRTRPGRTARTAQRPPTAAGSASLRWRSRLRHGLDL